MRSTDLIVVIALLASPGVAPAQTPPSVVQWGNATAERLAAFVPTEVDGLVDDLPWDVHRDYPVTLHGCLVGCLQFSPLSAQREWRVADPALAARHETAAAKALEDAVALISQLGTIPNEEFARRERAIEQSTALLERQGRTVVLTIQGNLRPQPQGREGSATQAGTLRGLPLMRFEFNSAEYGPTSRGIRYVVFLGAAEFNNPRVATTLMEGQLKAITVSASVQTTPEHASADEALLRRLLEQVDLEGLRRLIQ